MPIASGKRLREAQEKLSAAENRLNQLKSNLTEDQLTSLELSEIITKKKQEISHLDSDIKKKAVELEETSKQISEKQKQIVTFDDKILAQDFGLYEPRFDFMNCDEFKERIKEARAGQRKILKQVNEQIKFSTWTVDGSVTQGRKMLRETIRLLYRAFNSDCDDIIRRVKHNNIDKSIEAISKSADKISRLGATLGISITSEYARLKIEEAQLQFEYAQFKQREKEELREARELEREERRLQKEIEAARKKFVKEKTHYEKALKKVIAQLERGDGSKRDALLEKKAELEEQIKCTDKAIEDVDYREANQRAGFVYVASNIGAFGENVFKIGMTRRLNPAERIAELSGASVPYNYDVHAMIFTDDAPGLESCLHNRFEDRKLNLVNQRREFFAVTFDEIKQAVKENYDKTVEFVEFAEAEQFRISEKMRESK